MIKELIRWLMKRFGKKKTMAQKTNNQLPEQNSESADLVTTEVVVTEEITPTEEVVEVVVETVETTEVVEPTEILVDEILIEDVEEFSEAEAEADQTLDSFEILGVSNNTELSAAIRINGNVYTTDAKTLVQLSRYIETTLDKFGFKSTNHKV